jgi:predicted NAD/FAD-binding protein
MTRVKENLQAAELISATAARASGNLPWRFFLRFRQTYGLTLVEGRETTAVLTGEELAETIEAALSTRVEDPDDLQAVGRVARLLRSAAYNTQEE